MGEASTAAPQPPAAPWCFASPSPVYKQHLLPMARSERPLRIGGRRQHGQSKGRGPQQSSSLPNGTQFSVIEGIYHNLREQRKLKRKKKENRMNLILSRSTDQFVLSDPITPWLPT